MTPKQLKQRKCRGCAKEFMPTKPLQVVCSWECAKDVAENKRDRKEKKELREAIKGLKSRNDYKAEAQQEFNKFIRLRDAALPCVSCGRTEDQIENTYGGKWDCGHYLSRGSHPELAFEELNAHKQCKKCNGGAGKYAKKNHTVTESYRAELILRIGLDKVEWLKSKHDPKHYSIEDLKSIKAEYKKKIKELGK